MPRSGAPLAGHGRPAGGETTAIVNAARLRIKESDRLASVTQVLNALGAGVEEHADHLVRGRERLAAPPSPATTTTVSP